MAEIGALFLAGLALFFSGLAGIKSNLSQFAGRRFRELLSRMTHRPVVAAFLGIGFGAITQSASAVAFILSGMVTTGLVQLRRVLPVLAASNIGTVLLVFLASISLKLGILYLLGFTGILIAFELGGSRARPVLGLLFSVALLFYGLDLMKAAFAPLPSMPWFTDFAAFVSSWTIAPFFLGLVLRVLIQSSSAISVVAITLVQSGLLNEYQAAMLMTGAGPGVGLAAYLLSSRLSGVPRQVVIFQSVINAVAGLLIGVLLVLEQTLGFRGLSWLLDFCPGGTGGQLACLFLVLMLTAFLIGLLLMPFAPRLLEKLAPTTVGETLAKPKYLVDEALSLPETALALAAKEQGRFCRILPKHLTPLLGPSERKVEPPSHEVHIAAEALHREIAIFVKELVRRPHPAEMADRLLLVDRVQDTLVGIERDLFTFAGLAPGCRGSGALLGLYSTMTEALHTTLLTLGDVLNNEDPLDLEFLHIMTEDRGALMDRVRRSYLEHPELSSTGARSSLLYATSVFERIVWMTHQITSMLRKEKAPSPEVIEEVAASFDLVG